MKHSDGRGSTGDEHAPRPDDAHRGYDADDARAWAAGPYSGRGPKGYKRSSDRIVEEARDRLERDGQVDASDIEVTCEDGTIHLRGSVPTRAMKRRAEDCVESVYGVHDVMNELRVSEPAERSWPAPPGAIA